MGWNQASLESKHYLVSMLRPPCFSENALKNTGIKLSGVLKVINEILCISSRKHVFLNSDPLVPHCYIVKLGFTGVYIIFLISAQNVDCGYSLEPPRRGGSNEYPQSMFWAEIRKNIRFFFSENFHFLLVKFSVHLYKRVFVMLFSGKSDECLAWRFYYSTPRLSDRYQSPLEWFTVELGGRCQISPRVLLLQRA